MQKPRETDNNARRFATLRPIVAATALMLGACSGDPKIVEAPGDATKVMRQIVVRAVMAGGPSAPRVFVSARDTARLVDSVVADGVARIDVASDASIELTVRPEDTTAYFSSRAVQTIGRDTTIEVVLIPKRWRVRLGIYAGEERPIDITDAFALNPDGGRFLNFASPYEKVLAAWAPTSFPIGIGFDTTGVALWVPSDSVVFWSHVDDLNATLGRTVFRPARRGAFAPKGAIGISYDGPNTFYRGLLLLNEDDCVPPRRVCTDVRGEVMLQRGVLHAVSTTDMFAEYRQEEQRRTVNHELVHLLGFGHTCRRLSIMLVVSVNCLNPTKLPGRPTADDVAFFELVTEVAHVLAERPYAWNFNEAAATRR